MIVSNNNLGTSNLIVGAMYEGGPTISHEPLHHLVGTGNMGGIRTRNSKSGKTAFVAPLTTSEVKDWPDKIDLETGVVTYFGDNKSPELDALDRPGNRALRALFSRDLSTREGRAMCPPVFMFSSPDGHVARTVRFEGLLVPGSRGNSADWCVARQFPLKGGGMFENYVFKFTLLADGLITRAWLTDLVHDHPETHNSPHWWQEWRNTGGRVPLTLG